MKCELDIAKNVILTFLQSNINKDSLYAIYKINSNDLKILKEHIDYLKNVFEKASVQIEEQKE